MARKTIKSLEEIVGQKDKCIEGARAEIAKVRAEFHDLNRKYSEVLEQASAARSKLYDYQREKHDMAFNTCSANATAVEQVAEVRSLVARYFAAKADPVLCNDAAVLNELLNRITGAYINPSIIERARGQIMQPSPH